MTGTRAQVFTLEGVLAALVVLAGLAFALQTVVVTPTDGGASAGTADGDRLESVLATSAESGAVKRAVLAWTGSSFDGTGAGTSYFVDNLPDNGFGTALRDGLGTSVVVNVVVHYEGASGPGQQRLAYNGAPPEGAVRETVTVALYDADSIYDESGDPVGGTLASRPSGFLYVDDQHTGSASAGGDLYAVVEVEVVAWQP